MSAEERRPRSRRHTVALDRSSTHVEFEVDEFDEDSLYELSESDDEVDVLDLSSDSCRTSDDGLHEIRRSVRVGALRRARVEGDDVREGGNNVHAAGGAAVVVPVTASPAGPIAGLPDAAASVWCSSRPSTTIPASSCSALIRPQPFPKNRIVIDENLLKCVPREPAPQPPNQAREKRADDISGPVLNRAVSERSMSRSRSRTTPVPRSHALHSQERRMRRRAVKIAPSKCSALLHECVMSEDDSALEKLVNEGYNVNEQDANKSTALHCAATAGRIETVRLLLRLGSDVLHRNDLGYTALHSACVRGQEIVCEVLADSEHGRQVVTMAGYDGDTPLHWCCRLGNTATAKILLARGARVDVENNDGAVPLDLVPDAKRDEFEALMRGALQSRERG